MIRKEKFVYLLDSLEGKMIQKSRLAKYPWETFNAAKFSLWKVLEKGSLSEEVGSDVAERRALLWDLEWGAAAAEATNHDKGTASNHCIVIPDGIVIPESTNAASSSSAPPGTAPPGAKSSESSSKSSEESSDITMPPLPPPNVVDEFDIQDFIDEFKIGGPTHQLQLYYPLPKGKANRFTTITIRTCGGLDQATALAKVSR
jgi:hypothetical protein